MNAPRSTVFTLIALIALAALAPAPAARAGDGCVCGSEAIDCIEQGGPQYECALMWLKNPCYEPGHCWDAGGVNIAFAGNGIAGGPGVPVPQSAGVILIPFLIIGPDGLPVPPEDVISFSAKIIPTSPPAPGAVLNPPAFYDPQTGHYVVEFIPAGFDPYTPAICHGVGVLAHTTAQGAAVLVPDCPGDLNFDGTCNSADLNILLAAFADGPAGDLDLDADTDSNDLNILLSAFGSSCLPPV